MNKLKHVLRAYCASDWDECTQLVRKYSDDNEALIFVPGTLKVKTRRSL